MACHTAWFTAFNSKDASAVALEIFKGKTCDFFIFIYNLWFVYEFTQSMLYFWEQYASVRLCYNVCVCIRSKQNVMGMVNQWLFKAISSVNACNDKSACVKHLVASCLAYEFYFYFYLIMIIMSILHSILLCVIFSLLRVILLCNCGGNRSQTLIRSRYCWLTAGAHGVWLATQKCDLHLNVQALQQMFACSFEIRRHNFPRKDNKHGKTCFSQGRMYNEVWGGGLYCPWGRHPLLQLLRLLQKLFSYIRREASSWATTT